MNIHEYIDIIFVSINNKNSRAIIKIFDRSIRFLNILHQNVKYLPFCYLSCCDQVSENMISGRKHKIFKLLFVLVILAKILILFLPDISNKIVDKNDTFSRTKTRNYPVPGYPPRYINNSLWYPPCKYPSRQLKYITMRYSAAHLSARSVVLFVVP
jgi:hypothetical protein